MSYTPKYIVNAYYVDDKGNRRVDVLNWSGKASQKKLDDMRDSYNKSFVPGGINFEFSKSVGYCTHYYKMQLVRNNVFKTLKYESIAPAFEVV